MKKKKFKKILLKGNKKKKKPLTENKIKIKKNNEEIAELKKLLSKK